MLLWCCICLCHVNGDGFVFILPYRHLAFPPPWYFLRLFSVGYGLKDYLDTLIKVFSYLPFPEPNHQPSLALQSSGDFFIPLHVPLNFRHPIVPVGFDPLIAVFPVVPVPVVRVAENCDFILRNDNIRLSYEFLVILSISYAPLPQGLPQAEFNRSVFAPNGLHILPALFRC